MKRSDSNQAIITAKEAFRALLKNASGQYHFHKFLMKEQSNENLDFWLAVEEFKVKEQSGKKKKKGSARVAKAIIDKYIREGSEHQINIQSDLKDAILQRLKKRPRDLFDDAQNHIFDLMFNDSYRRFVFIALQKKAQKELQQNKEDQLGSILQGLGDCFCLTDPSLPDNPIVGASDGFVSVTRYTRQDIINNNCRFLQGQETDKSVVKRMSESLKAEREVTELLLNFKKDGTPFWNLLYICPLKDATGKTIFFLGGQVDVTRNINNATPVKDVLEGLEAINQSSAEELNKIGAEKKKKMKKGSGEKVNTLNADNSIQTGSVRTTKSGGGGGGFFGLFRKKSSHEKMLVASPGAEVSIMDPTLDLDAQKEVFLETYSNFVIFSPEDKNGNVKFVSKRFSELTGFAEQNVIGRDLSFLRGPLTSKRVIKELKTAIKQGLEWSKQIVAYDAKGQPHLSNLFLTPIKDESQKAKLFIAVMKWREMGETEYEEAKWKSNMEKNDPEFSSEDRKSVV